MRGEMSCADAGYRKGRTVTEEDRRYFEQRAEQELEMAAATDVPTACSSHYTLANLYLALVFDDATADAA